MNMDDIAKVVRSVGEDDQVLDFVSEEPGDVRLSAEGWAKQLTWPDGAWRDVTLAPDDEALNMRIVQTIRQAVAGNLANIRWLDARIEEAERRSLNILPQDIQARLDDVMSSYEKYLLRPQGGTVLGVVFPISPTDFQVFLGDDDSAWIRALPDVTWTQIDMPVEFLRSIYNATVHLHMQWKRRLDTLRELDPAIRDLPSDGGGE
jgi:hypothetical protein